MAGILDGLFQPGATFGSNSPETQAQAPRGFLDNLISGLARSIYAGVRAPGDAYASQTPISSDQMVAPAMDMAAMMTLGAGAVPAGANELRAGMLNVARRSPNGEIRIGKPGDIHSDLMTRKELSTASDSPEVAASMGYATPEGKFLTRDEALQFAMKNEPNRAAWSAQQPQYGLDAATYHNEPKL